MVQTFEKKSKEKQGNPLPKKIGVVSLGCPKNLTDSEVMMGSLRQAGYEVTSHVEEADAVVVNTCSFLQASVQESLDTIHEMTRLKKTGRCQQVIVAGCLVERYGEKLLQDLPQVDGFLGGGHLTQVSDLLQKPMGKKKMLLGNGTALYSHETPRVKGTNPWTAYVKISEGCDHTCAFCTIPSIRGKFKSRKIESVVAEVEALVSHGLKEVVLVAQDSTMYGLDVYGKLVLDELLAALGKVKELSWIRVLYGYPSQLSQKMIQEIVENEKVVPYFDMPIQHASSEVLHRMKRGYGKGTIQKIVQSFRKESPDFAIRTTVIVGFPGEKEEHVAELLSFLEEVHFDHVGAFVYSNEPGTAAACLEEQVPDAVKEERYHRVMEKQQGLSLERNARFVGKTLPVLVESQVSERPLTYRGRSFRDAPEIDGSVLFESCQPISLGTFVPVRIREARPYDLIGGQVT